ncbi:GDP-mannose 3,5-epimerase 1 [Neolecta irregularis DAH-3]|uniref:GDP-mannose 3,5-epimerase 1 n=1 Tax=Neolecta irregularis (strain DAH-3) TaxID=1198029 RepID=A0A1U7LMU4_NEOID|nr:GDP-mannose 3,5-epimerase 1 [Neolecta irregularis DAH-3]|eukprot:OLL23975.1 GDP-mannose 3,5-epimerase 1 [Neolecta irregularis DAH-3]
MNRVLITGGNGFIGSHLAKRLYQLGFFVRILDVAPKSPTLTCSEYLQGDLCNLDVARQAVKSITWVFHLAANMGGMGTIHSHNDIHIYQENSTMTMNILISSISTKVRKFFFASSACVYPENLQEVGMSIKLNEDEVWKHPPAPQDLYGTEKLVSEIIMRQLKSSTQIFTARFHNVYGPGGTWLGGREKAPAALCRKAIASKLSGELDMEIWGDGRQTRSFLYIDDCIDAVLLLVNSDLTDPVNIGSEEVIEIRELAILAWESCGISRKDIIFSYDLSKPRGVASRNSDGSFIKMKLGWTPKIDIATGISLLSRAIELEIEKTLLPVAEDLKSRLLRDYRASKLVHLDVDNTKTFAVLLPVTSRGSVDPRDCLSNLHNFSLSLQSTTYADRVGIHGGNYFKIKIYLCIDDSDRFLVESSEAENILRSHAFEDITTLTFSYPLGSICSIWRDAAHQAYLDACDYFVLFGDDVVIHTPSWPSKIDAAFLYLSKKLNFPKGFGCITFRDISFPGMPTFPVVSRLHMEIFSGEIFPDTFNNQHADPYLFQLYRPWGSSSMLETTCLENKIGGAGSARYIKAGSHNWTFDSLSCGIDSICDWMAKQEISATRKITIDVVVPCYRVTIPYLQRILELKCSEGASVMFIIIIDDPASPNIGPLKNMYDSSPFIRIRVNEANLGASEARNRGLKECCGDWILFFDDDVIPDPNVLFEAEKMARKYPKACGFIGNSKFPPAETILSNAVIMAGVTYFWDVAEKIPTDVPWGVTANLMIRRVDDDIWFDPRFPKTGGGEDIDFCLRKKKFYTRTVKDGMGFISAPKLKVIHPWWNNGYPSLWRFYGWSKGDGALQFMYPEHTYWDCSPNSGEMLIILNLGLIIGLLRGVWGMGLGVLWFSVVGLFNVFLINILSEIHRYSTSSDVPGIKSHRRIIAAAIGAFIRIASELGRTMGQFSRGEFAVGQRFDWFAGRLGDRPKNNEREMSGLRFTGWLALMIGVYIYH